MAEETQTRKPKILILATLSGGYAGADSVGQLHTDYAANTYVFPVRSPAMFPEEFYLRAFERGIDADPVGVRRGVVAAVAVPAALALAGPALLAVLRVWVGDQRDLAVRREREHVAAARGVLEGGGELAHATRSSTRR